MKDYEVNLKRALSQAPAPDLQQLMQEPVEKMQEHDDVTRQQKKKGMIYHWKPLVSACAACACLCIILAGWLIRNNRTDSYIELDINPSLELAVNRKDQVLSVEGLNEDAGKVIENLDWHKKDVDTVMTDILEEMLREGYFKDTKNMILLSVDNKDNKRAEDLMNRLEKQMQDYLNSRDIHPTIIRQLISGSDEERNLARAHKMSMGKLYLIHEIMEMDDTLRFEELSELSVGELTNIYEKLKYPASTTVPSKDIDNTDKKVPSKKEDKSPAPSKNNTEKKKNNSRPDNDDDSDNDEDNDDEDDDRPGKVSPSKPARKTDDDHDDDDDGKPESDEPDDDDEEDND